MLEQVPGQIAGLENIIGEEIAHLTFQEIPIVARCINRLGTGGRKLSKILGK